MKVKAYAKVNLSLDITGKRADGYHTLESVFQSVSLCDFLTVESADSISVRCSKADLSGEGNLCFKAARLFFEKTGAQAGADIYIEKHIPEAAGLGGGSADAAATLVALNELFGLPLSVNELLEIALKIGADVPFCMLGGTKLCEGIGEIMTELPSLPACFIVIAKRGVKSSTGDMYRALDSTFDRRKSDTESIINGLESGVLGEVFSGAYNCFESVSDSADIECVRHIAERFSSVYCGLSGAGPSVVSVFSEKGVAEKVFKELEANGFWCDVVTPIGCGVEIIE